MEILQFVIWDPVSSKLQTNLSENYKLHKSLPENGQKVSIINLIEPNLHSIFALSMNEGRVRLSLSVK